MASNGVNRQEREKMEEKENRRQKIKRLDATRRRRSAVAAVRRSTAFGIVLGICIGYFLGNMNGSWPAPDTAAVSKPSAPPFAPPVRALFVQKEVLFAATKRTDRLLKDVDLNLAAIEGRVI